MEKVVIYHNPACGTSRNVLAIIRHVGIEPEIVHYLDTHRVRKNCMIYCPKWE